MPDFSIKTYSCKECGKPFESKGYNVFYCEECRRKKRKQIQHNAYRRTHPIKYIEKNCRICGKIFEGTRTQFYCSEECVEKGAILQVQRRKFDSYIMYLAPGNKEKMEAFRREMGFGTMSALLKTALSEYITNHVKDKEKLNEAKKLLED